MSNKLGIYNIFDQSLHLGKLQSTKAATSALSTLQFRKRNYTLSEPEMGVPMMHPTLEKVPIHLLKRRLVQDPLICTMVRWRQITGKQVTAFSQLYPGTHSLDDRRTTEKKDWGRRCHFDGRSPKTPLGTFTQTHTSSYV